MSDTSDPESDASQRVPGTRARVVIEYCPRCGWLLRAAWLTQELLSTFETNLEEVALRPAGKGVFRICVAGHEVWSRQQDGGFPSAAELKRRVRDRVAPGQPLGHIDQADK